jgi:hypothetical protein
MHSVVYNCCTKSSPILGEIQKKPAQSRCPSLSDPPPVISTFKNISPLLPPASMKLS